MKGFVYTLLIMLLVVSFTYVIVIQNNVSEFPHQSYDKLILSNFEKNKQNLPYNYEQVVENYKIMKNMKQ